MESKLATPADFLSKTDSLIAKMIEVEAIGVPYDEKFLTAFWTATRLISPSSTSILF